MVIRALPTTGSLLAALFLATELVRPPAPSQRPTPALGSLLYACRHQLRLTLSGVRVLSSRRSLLPMSIVPVGSTFRAAILLVTVLSRAVGVPATGTNREEPAFTFTVSMAREAAATTAGTEPFPIESEPVPETAASTPPVLIVVEP